jgi:hypothetical protein
MRRGRAHILELLRALGPVAEQVDRQGRQDGLLGEVRGLLPVAERPHCLRASRQGDVLSLTLDSAAWVTRLRYRIPQLVLAFSPTGITAIKTRVEPPGQGAIGPSKGGMSRRSGIWLTPQVAGHLLAAADEIGDPRIAEALRRLARRRAGGPSPPRA